MLRFKRKPKFQPDYTKIAELERELLGIGYTNLRPGIQPPEPKSRPIPANFGKICPDCGFEAMCAAGYCLHCGWTYTPEPRQYV